MSTDVPHSEWRISHWRHKFRSVSVCVDHLKDEADDEAYTGDIRQRVTPHTLVIVMGDRFAHDSPL
jgi:hypothetical protein